MLFTLGVLLMVFGILFSIAWHELGHMIPAKKFGVKVTQYMVGFGPTMWSKKRGDTEYGLKWLPFGGYIRMIGMFPPGPDGKVKESTTGRLGALVEEAREVSQAEVLTLEDQKRTFYTLSVPKKLVVMLGGPVMNLILAAFLFAVMLMGVGTPAATTTLSKVPDSYKTGALNGQSGGPEIPGPAAQAGIKAGDQIISFDGQSVSSWPQLTSLIVAVPGQTVPMVVARGGNDLNVTVDIATVDRPVVVDGRPTDEIRPQGFLGVSPEVELQKQPASAVPTQMWDLTVRSAQAMVAIPVKLVGVAQAAFAGEERDPNGPVGIVGVGRISGEVAAEEQLPVSWRVAQLLGILASLNLFLFLFNLLPVLPLDGGHVAGALWEGARRKIAKLRGRPDPGPVDVAKALPLAYGVAILLIGMSVLLLYADIVNPISLGG